MHDDLFPHILLIEIAPATLLNPNGKAPVDLNSRFAFYDAKGAALAWEQVIALAQARGLVELSLTDKAAPITEGRHVARILLVNTDIAILEWQSRQQVAEDLEADARRRHQLSRMVTLGELASEIAHEINNPIMIIAGNIAILEESLDQAAILDDYIKPLTKIKSVTTTVQRIIRSLQIISRDGYHDPFAAVTFREILEGVLPLCEDKFFGAGVDLQINYEDAEFSCRKVEIVQVLANLLLNAFHAALSTTDKWVRLEFAADRNAVHIRVIDSGKGIPSDMLTKIMQPYFTTKELGKGTGLGLSIALGIIKDHRGTLRVDAECANTCFCISFPRTR